MRIVAFSRNGTTQYGVRTGDRSFVKLDLVNDEILSQTRQRGLLPDAREVAEMALEKLLVREHRDAIRPGGLVLPRDRDRVEVLGDDAGTGRRLFHLGDEAQLIRPAIEPPREAAKFVAIERRGAQQFHFRKQTRDFTGFGIQNFIEAVRRHEAGDFPDRPSA